MKVLVDKNILISTFVFGGPTGKLFDALFDSDIEILVSEYVDSEFKEKLSQKWPDKSEKLVYILETVTLNLFQGLFNRRFRNEFGMTLNRLIRDKKDVPVLSDAIFNNADVLLTGDNDFLDSDIEKPLIFSPKMMIDFLGIAD